MSTAQANFGLTEYYYVNWIWSICRDYVKVIVSLFFMFSNWYSNPSSTLFNPYNIVLCQCYVNHPSQFWPHRVLCELDLKQLCRDYVKVMLSLFSWFPTGIQNLDQHCLIPIILSLCQCYVNHPSQFWPHRVLCELDLKHMQRLCKSYVIPIFMVSRWYSKPRSTLFNPYIAPMSVLCQLPKPILASQSAMWIAFKAYADTI